MPTGFIYVVTSVTRRYAQGSFNAVPTEWEGRLYFGACKRSMRPKMQPGDYVFGVSPSTTNPRRIVYAAKIDKRITFAKAYRCLPRKLRGPDGPIHVRPVNPANRGDSFPRSHYEHIAGSMHANDWERDLASQDRDAFFVCTPEEGCIGRWLGERGPEVDEQVLRFLKTCSVHGASGPLSRKNSHATLKCPVVHMDHGGLLYKGLHLETAEPEAIVRLCQERTRPEGEPSDRAPRIPVAEQRALGCGTRNKTRACRSANEVSHVVGANQILFLRVGMDLGFGGLGPIFPDGRFEYVPIPENPKKTSSRSLYFSGIAARSGGTLDRFAPPRHRTGRTLRSGI